MKLKFSTTSLIDILQAVGFGIVAGSLSEGAIALLPDKAQGALARGGVAVGSVVLASTLQGNDTATNIVKSSLVGVAIQQGREAVVNATHPMLEKTKNKFIKGALRGTDDLDLLTAETEEYDEYETLPYDYAQLPEAQPVDAMSFQDF